MLSSFPAQSSTSKAKRLIRRRSIPITTLCRRVATSGWFQTSILCVILFNAAVMGLETSQGLRAEHARLFGSLNTAVQTIYVLELAIRLAAHWPRVLRFFRDGWNTFDFIVITASLLPAVGPFATVARLARVLRISRLLSTFPELRLIVATLLRSIPSMGHIILLLALLFYVYAILGFSMFQAHDPEHWATLGGSVLTLFQILTLEGWIDVQSGTLAAHPWAWVYFASFIVIGVYVVINLFIAVIINNLESAREEQRNARDAQSRSAEFLQTIEALKSDLSRLEMQLRAKNGVSV